MNYWPYIKAVMAHLGGDWGCQSATQAMHKATCRRCRLQHVVIVGLVHMLAALTSERVSGRRRAAYVVVNVATHYAVDSVRLPKVVDQVLHVAVAVVTAGWWLRER